MNPDLRKITLNGEARAVHAASIAQLVEELELPAPTILVEHNGDALQRDQWESCALAAGDRVELLRIAAGG